MRTFEEKIESAKENLPANYSEEEVCGYEINPDELPGDWGSWCCCRTKWKDQEYCIFHAEAHGKPYKVLQEEKLTPNILAKARPDTPRLDDANLRHTDLAREELPDHPLAAYTVDFGGTALFNANFYGATVTGCKFDNSRLDGANFKQITADHVFFNRSSLKDADFARANLTHANFQSSIAKGADFRDAILEEANCYDADFTDSDLRYADLTDTYLSDVTLQRANLEGATLIHTDLSGADLTNARLYDAELRDTILDEGTKLGDRCKYEKEADNDEMKPEKSTESLEKAIRIYRVYQRVLRENDLPRQIRHYRIRERECRRKLAARNDGYQQWLNYSLQKWTTEYGESPKRVIFVSSLVIVLFTFLYPIFGFQTSSRGFVSYTASLEQLPAILGQSLYFSLLTFTTLGYGDVRPVGYVQALASIEAFIGSLLMALLVFVLGRRTAW